MVRGCKDITFHGFSKLPQEIQDMIWAAAMPGPRIVKIGTDVRQNMWGTYWVCKSDSPTPVLLHTTSRSREVAKRTHQLKFSGSLYGSPVYFNFNIDCLFFEDVCSFLAWNGRRPIHSMIEPTYIPTVTPAWDADIKETEKQLRKMILGHGLQIRHPRGRTEHFAEFTALETLVVSHNSTVTLSVRWIRGKMQENWDAKHPENGKQMYEINTMMNQDVDEMVKLAKIGYQDWEKMWETRGRKKRSKRPKRGVKRLAPP